MPYNLKGNFPPRLKKSRTKAPELTGYMTRDQYIRFFDGQVWVFKGGKDFDGKPSNLMSRFRRWACVEGAEIEIGQEKDRVYFQAIGGGV